MHQSGLHITTNFHIMKWWIQSRKGKPAIVSVKNKKFPTVMFEHSHSRHMRSVSWSEFFDCMVAHELAFMYEAEHEDMNKGEFFKLVPWEEFIEEIRVEEKTEDKSMIAQTVFS